EPGWNLSDLLPNTNGFDGNKLFQSTDSPELSNGSYQILMRYVNPLEAINADAKKLRFANAGQDVDGWLVLGSEEVPNSAAEVAVRVTELTSNTSKEIPLTTGSNKELDVTVAPADADNKRVVWSSSDLKVAYVSAAGLVTAVGEG